MITATLSLQKRLQSFARGSNYIALTMTRGGSNVISTNGLAPIPLSKEEGGHQVKRKESIVHQKFPCPSLERDLLPGRNSAFFFRILLAFVTSSRS